MILAITMNPSVDISYPLDKFVIDDVNRVKNVRKTAGGKGLNVARVAHLSGQQVIATGLLGGTIGQYICKELDKDNIRHDFCAIAGESRNCIAILHESLQTEILESGPIISEQEQLAFKQHLKQLLSQVDVITISGSLPSGISDDYYAQLIELANQQNKKVLLDSSGSSLKKAISHQSRPYLIKPNHEELGQLVNKKLDPLDIDGLIDAIKSEPNLAEIPIVVVSLGKEGALVKYNTRFLRVIIPKINVVNPVGSGDSTLAGLAIGVQSNESVENMLKRAMVLGMLNTMEAQTGYVNISNYDTLFEKVDILEIEQSN